MKLLSASFAVPFLFFAPAVRIHGQLLSSSKLSAHLINAYTAGGSNVVAGHPRTLKVLGLDSGFPTAMAQAMRAYKAQVPSGLVVVRIYSPTNYVLTDNATTRAGDFWTNVLQRSLNTLAPADRALIDYLEGPNEGQTPTLGYPSSAPLQASQWFNQFWTNLTPFIVAASYKPCIGSIAVGNPGGTTAQMQSYLAAFVPALRQAKAANGAWSYHAYTLNYTTDIGTEIWYSLRYRQFYSYFASAYPDLAAMPLILTEGGVDETGTPATSGWQARGTAADYERWLNWFDNQLLQDSYVMGCTLFEIGNPESWGWPSFDLEPVASWMRNYLLTPVNVPPPPSSLIAVAGPRSVTLTWTNPPLNPTTWSLKRSTNSTGPFFTIVTNLLMSVPGATYTDTAVANNVTYYYVVTAVNALGESDNSPVASATPTAPAYSAINCGAGAIGPFTTDAYYNAGFPYATASAVNTNGLNAPAPMAVYQSQRYSNLTYTISYLAPAMSYKVRLHFAEIYWTTTGQRVFNVTLSGVRVLSNFDIIRAAGANLKGNIQEFNAISDLNGTITIQLQSVTDNASINGLEFIANPANVIPAAPTNLVASLSGALVNLTWSVPASASAFTVKRSTTSGGPYSIIASNLTQATYRDPGFAPGVTYFYVVSASNAAVESSNSSEASVSPVAALPELVVSSLTWSPVNLYAASHAVFSAEILNRGSAATPAGNVLSVGFKIDGVGVSWSRTYTNALAPGESVALAADGGPAGVNYWFATSGVHSLTAAVDDLNLISESIETDNTLSVPLAVFFDGYAFNSGGGAIGGFAADANFGGSANTLTVTSNIDLSLAADPAPMTVYQSERWGEFGYVFSNLAPGNNYKVRLHFAEISPSVNSAGARQFNVVVNGILVINNLDGLALAGAKFRAATLEIMKQADSSGTLTVQFTRGAAGEPACNGVEVFGSAPAPAPVISGLSFSNSVSVLTWQSTPAAIYQPQFKNTLQDASWTNLGYPMLASGNSLSLSDPPSASATRFYRVVLLQ